MRYQGVGTVAYAQQPIGPYEAASLGCGLGFISPTWQVCLLLSLSWGPGISAHWLQWQLLVVY